MKAPICELQVNVIADDSEEVGEGDTEGHASYIITADVHFTSSKITRYVIDVHTKEQVNGFTLTYVYEVIITSNIKNKSNCTTILSVKS